MAQKIISSLTQQPARLWHFVQEAREEMRKVSWPNRETTIRYTLIVIAASLGVGAIIGGVDYLLTVLLEATI